MCAGIKRFPLAAMSAPAANTGDGTKKLKKQGVERQCSWIKKTASLRKLRMLSSGSRKKPRIPVCTFSGSGCQLNRENLRDGQGVSCHFFLAANNARHVLHLTGEPVPAIVDPAERRKQGLERFWLYLILSVLYAFASIATSWMISTGQRNWKIWLTAGPNIILMVLVVALMFHDLMNVKLIFL